MPLTNNTNDNYTIRQLKLPLEIEKLIDIADPVYNVQAAICDEYIAVIDAKPYASDQDCFVPLMEKFKETYGHYPKYPVADAGYGSYNNYHYCEEHGMEKYMKFTRFEKKPKTKSITQTLTVQ